MVSRAHLFCAYQRPIVRIVLPLLTVPISHRCQSPLRLFILNRAKIHDFIHPKDKHKGLKENT